MGCHTSRVKELWKEIDKSCPWTPGNEACFYAISLLGEIVSLCRNSGETYPRCKDGLDLLGRAHALCMKAYKDKSSYQCETARSRRNEAYNKCSV